MPDKKDEGPTFEELKKEMDAFFADFEKKLKGMKLDKKTHDTALKTLMPMKKDLLAFSKKNQKNNVVPLKQLQPVADKSFKGIPGIYVAAAKGSPPEVPDGIKLGIGSKKMHLVLKTSWDPKKQQLKFVPMGGMKWTF